MGVYDRRLLFDQWHSLSQKVEDAGAVVQNDMPVTEEVLYDFSALSLELAEDLQALIKATVMYLLLRGLKDG